MGNARNAIERTFSPEFRNRLDAWVSFESLPPEVIAKVVDKMVAELAVQLQPKKVSVDLTAAGRAWLAEHGFDRLMGARPMGRIIQKKVKEPLAEKILFGELKEGGHVTIDAADDQLRLEESPRCRPSPWSEGGAVSRIAFVPSSRLPPGAGACLRDDEFPRDSVGSAKIALIAIDRSIAAWAVIRHYVTEGAKGVIDAIAFLDSLRQAVEKTFPNARSFVRPGFDSMTK